MTRSTVPWRTSAVPRGSSSTRASIAARIGITDATLVRGAFAVTAAAYTNNFMGATATTLFVIDTQNDRLLTQNPPNNGALNDVGSLGIDATDVNGFEIVGPMAAIVLGGLISTTLLTLVVLPAAYLRFGFVAEPDRSAEDLLVTVPDVDTVGR